MYVLRTLCQVVALCLWACKRKKKNFKKKYRGEVPQESSWIPKAQSIDWSPGSLEEFQKTEEAFSKSCTGRLAETIQVDRHSQGFKREANRVGEDLCPRRFRRANCARSGARALGLQARVCSSAGRRGGSRSWAQGKPREQNGEDTQGGTGQLAGLTWSCWLRAAATVFRAATSTLLQRLCAPPRPYSPRLPKAPPPVPNLILRSSGCCREPPYSLSPPGPRVASPVQSEEVVESQRVSPKIPKSSIQRSASPRPPSTPTPFSSPPPPLPGPSSWPFGALGFRGVFSSSCSSRSPCARFSAAAVCLLSLLLLFLLLPLLEAPPLSAGGSGAACPLLPQPLVCFFVLLLLLKRSLWPQIATPLPPSAPSAPSLLPPKSEAQPRVVIIKERALMRQFVSASLHLGSLIQDACGIYFGVKRVRKRGCPFVSTICMLCA
ncbi:stress response protein NST1-like [Phyllostomus hastatus]|uniref:stress response protein NST1-like n=1 Tax=Phyllostomus hastatus TaxID=9423 RepID=UPI001E684E56|nr:stress response protein NST1-like [Phyllostomus hastatus]